MKKDSSIEEDLVEGGMRENGSHSCRAVGDENNEDVPGPREVTASQVEDYLEGINEPPAEEYAMMLEVTMADRPGWPHPPAFSWNTGMVMHILKKDPVLRELEHVQVDSLGTAYLFYYDKQGCQGLGQDTV